MGVKQAHPLSTKTPHVSTPMNPPFLLPTTPLQLPCHNSPGVVTLRASPPMVKLNCKSSSTKLNLCQSSIWVGGICPTYILVFQANFNMLYLFFSNMLYKTTMPLLSRGNWFACLILPSLQYMSAWPLQTCYVLHDIHCTKIALGVQFIRFADGWDNSRLKLNYSTFDLQFSMWWVTMLLVILIGWC